MKKYFEHLLNPLIEVKSSSIHNKGVFAKKNISKGTKILTYIGKKITKEESDKLYEKQYQKHKKNPKKVASVYTYDFDEIHDLNGDVWWNLAKYINHSCDGNCEALREEDNSIAIYSIRDIKKGEELNYNYGYDVENWQDHPCKCGSKNCVEYIVSQDQWDILNELKKEKLQNQHINK